MESKELLRQQLELSMGMILPLIEDMRDAPLTFPTSKGGNHPLWILGHVAYSLDTVIQSMMLGKPNPLAEWRPIFGSGTEPVADADVYPPFDKVMAQCQAAVQRSVAVLDSLSEADLDLPSKDVPDEYKKFFGTYRQCLLMVTSHALTHLGQVADARRAAGRAPLRR